ncbi:uncharacterized protein LOC105224439 isoform X2 [Bactrocera dorsalis]|uniref:Uncharacterized protein LOC105224439 isoform X2 n=1 Tax=Bactrocera dorsalis TaxID=27457 RepID=A0ABM3K0N4_BACDO|nr:uncharacterized protein LOC105224439 isoform X2 [Bactrocera dorsalis]
MDISATSDSNKPINHGNTCVDKLRPRRQNDESVRAFRKSKKNLGYARNRLLKRGVVPSIYENSSEGSDIKTTSAQRPLVHDTYIAESNDQRGLPLQIIGDIVIEHDNNQMEVNDGNLTIDHVQKPRQMIEVRLNKAPKTSAERGREFRARKALLKQQCKQQQEPVPKPSEITTIERRAKSAEATRRWREKKKALVGHQKKQAKTAAQRIREYRERKKLAKKVLLEQQSHQDLDAVVSTSSSQVNQRAGPSTINSISAELTNMDLEEKRKELKRIKRQKNHNARQRAYYQRQKDLKKNEEIKKEIKIMKTAPKSKSNAERQRKFRQHNAEKSYMDIKRQEEILAADMKANRNMESETELKTIDNSEDIAEDTEKPTTLNTLRTKSHQICSTNAATITLTTTGCMTERKKATPYENLSSEEKGLKAFFDAMLGATQRLPEFHQRRIKGDLVKALRHQGVNITE